MDTIRDTVRAELARIAPSQRQQATALLDAISDTPTGEPDWTRLTGYADTIEQVDLDDVDVHDLIGVYCGNCGEHAYPAANGVRRCSNLGECETADRQATSQSLRRGAASSAQPAAWTSIGQTD